MEETSEPKQTGIALTESQAEQRIQLINQAASSGVATTWRTCLDELFQTNCTYEPVEVLRILDGLRKKNLVQRYTAFRKMVTDPMDHPVFAWGEVCFAAHANDYGRAMDFATEASAIFPDRYDLSSVNLFLLTTMKANSERCVDSTNNFLKRFSDQPGAWLAAEYFSRQWKNGEYNTRLRGYILKYFPDTNVQRAILRDMAFEAGNFQTAIEYARTVVAHDPSSGFAWHALATIELAMGNAKNAKAACDHAISIQPFNRSFLELSAKIERNIA